jgi:sugar/nucleoside kinase (ribokinase family)
VSSVRLPQLVAIGDLLLDVVVTPSRPIERGTDVPGSVRFRRGGSAANVAAAFVRAGGAASLITALGRDALATRLLASLRADGVTVHAIQRSGVSGRLTAIVDERGERSFVTERGAADALDPEAVRSSWLRSADILHVPAYSLLSEPIGEAAIRAADLARQRGLQVSADLSSAGPILAYGVRRARARMSRLAPEVLFATRDEAAALVGRTGRRSWHDLAQWSPLVVVKDGAWGCRVLWRTVSSSGQLDVAAERLGLIDATGAGDAFAAGFLFALARQGQRVDAIDPAAFRRAALAGHRTAAAALRRGRPEIVLG